ncbi:hypothetical protein BY996DRAFT_4578113, partial [Phakopsora pachyrhizi]
FQDLAVGTYQSYKTYLNEHSIPKLSQLNHKPYINFCPDDFASAITYTFNEFSNKAHCDNDTDNWISIGFIPIKKNGSLAYKEFDVQGGEFVIRDLKVFIDFTKVKGITLITLKPTNIFIKLFHQNQHLCHRGPPGTILGYGPERSEQT